MSPFPVAPRPLTCTRRMHAPAARVFDLLADPRRHQELDGSGTLRGLLQGPVRLRAGDRFQMSMRYWGIPYRITSTVVEYEPDRLIAWSHVSRVIWRFELRPVPEGTEVTQTWDLGASPAWPVYQALGFQGRTRTAMVQTLERLRSRVEE